MKAKDVTQGMRVGDWLVIAADSARNAEKFGAAWAERIIIWLMLDSAEQTPIMAMNVHVETDVVGFT